MTAKAIVSCVRALAFAGALVVSAAAHSASIPGLFNTGVDNAGVALGDGAADPHYTMITQFSGTPVTINNAAIPGSWIDNNLAANAGADYRWVWQAANGQPTSVTRTFRLTFDLTGLDPSSASISGLWATDNSGPSIRINGSIVPAQTCGGFSAFCSFSVLSGFVAGVNTLDFVVSDAGAIAGFLVGSISGTAAVAAIPEPSTYALMLAGLVFIGYVAHRRRRARFA